MTRFIIAVTSFVSISVFSQNNLEDALNGDRTAQYNIASEFIKSDEPKSKERAFAWYQMSALQNHTESQVALAEMYYSGIGTQRDKIASLYWYDRASINGDDNATDIIIKRFEINEAKSLQLALLHDMYFKANYINDERAMYNLAGSYTEKEFLEPDFEKAFYWYKKSAELGYGAVPFIQGR